MSRLERARARLAERYRRSLPSKIETLATTAAALEQGDREAESTLRRVAHQLRGSGASYGIPQITEAAAAVELAQDGELAAAVDGLIEVLRHASEQDAHEGGTLAGSVHVLIVEDDDALVDLMEHDLVGPDREIHRATTMDEAWTRLDCLPLDLVILDLTLPDGDGRNLLAALADHAETADVPVLVLSATSAPQTKAECLALGAVQYLEKPVSGNVLTAAVDGILLRRQRHAEEIGIDMLTGLSNRAGFREAFERAFKLSDRASLPAALAILDLDRFKSLNDDYGHNFGDEVLRRTGRVFVESLRQTDLCARWGGEEFVVLFQGTRADQALIALEKLRRSLRAERFETDNGDSPVITLSGGIVDLDSPETLEDSLARADKLLYHAKSSGRDRILTSFPAEGPSLTVRILLAEDDDDAAELVSGALAAEGFVVARYSDGRAALSAALDSPHDMAILDKQMPGLDGFEVLEQMRGDSRYEGVPILMLTAVGREDEIERAFNLGADDYVQKPFKPRELLARARRLLRR